MRLGRRALGEARAINSAERGVHMYFWLTCSAMLNKNRSLFEEVCEYDQWTGSSWEFWQYVTHFPYAHVTLTRQVSIIIFSYIQIIIIRIFAPPCNLRIYTV